MATFFVVFLVALPVSFAASFVALNEVYGAVLEGAGVPFGGAGPHDPGMKLRNLARNG